MVDPVLVISRNGKHDTKYIAVFDEEFGRMEYETPKIHVNLDKTHEIDIVFPDGIVNIMQWGKGKDGKHRTWVRVLPRVVNGEDDKTFDARRRIQLISFDDQRETNIEIAGDRRPDKLYSRWLVSDVKEQLGIEITNEEQES